MRARILFPLWLLLLGTIAMGQTTTTPTGKFPALRVDAAVGTQQRQLPGSFYKKTMDINPKVVVEGTSRMTAVPAAEATMVIVTMDTRAKYKEKSDDAFSIHAAETIPIPAAPGGERREFKFASSSVTFDSYRDNSNVGGAV